jgi:hypothetical protein
MNMDILDSISELEISQKKAKAVLDGFMQQFTTAEKKTAMLSIDSHFEQFQYMAHVICDLMHKAIEQTAELERLADAQMKKAV